LERLRDIQVDPFCAKKVHISNFERKKSDAVFLLKKNILSSLAASIAGKINCFHSFIATVTFDRRAVTVPTNFRFPKVRFFSPVFDFVHFQAIQEHDGLQAALGGVRHDNGSFDNLFTVAFFIFNLNGPT
jgi:hypothetical protein